MIQLLSGRSALLGDGFSRNPSNRDELIEQWTKDLKGVAGQTRGFSVDEFLSDLSERMVSPFLGPSRPTRNQCQSGKWKR